MNDFKLTTFNKSNPINQPHFFILNKGINSGKPLKQPCPNAFTLTCQQSQLDFYYWLIFGLWRSNAFHPFLRGSVIPFIIKKELIHCISQAEDKARQNLDSFNKNIQILQLLEAQELKFQQNLKLIEKARTAIFYQYRSFST